MGAIPLIELRRVTCLRGAYAAIKEASLELDEGQTLFVMGGAGSGKSVLLKTAAGIALPAEGEVLYKGLSLDRMSVREEAAFRRSSGFVFQDAALWANMSLYDNLALPARLHEKAWGAAEVDKAVRRAAELVGYGEELRVRPAELSSGERKLVGLARALVLDPELLFMDDPASSLDEAAAERVSGIMATLKERGRSVLVASGSSDLASRHADRIAVLIGGSFAATGDYSEAVGWTEAAVRAVTGRLKARAAPLPEWASGLAGAWASALAEDTAAEDPTADATGFEGKHDDEKKDGS